MTEEAPSARYPPRSSSLTTAASQSRAGHPLEKRSSEQSVSGSATNTTTTSVSSSGGASGAQSTESFIRRTLCAHQLHAGGYGGDKAAPPIDQLLPPLTSSNEVDVQLYAFIAILIRELVQPWYGKFTSDHALVDEVIQIVAHCTRALEQRLRGVDVERLVMQEVAALFDAHVTAYRLSHRAAQDPASALSVRRVYHSLRPHPALSPVPDEEEPHTVEEQQRNDAAYRHLLAQGLFAVLLPTEDLQNPCLRSLVSEVGADFILGNFLGGHLCESVFIYDLVRKASYSIQQRFGIQGWTVDPAEEAADQVDKHGVAGEHSEARPPRRRRTLSELFWRGIHYAWLIITGLRALIIALAHSSSLSSRGSTTSTSISQPSSPTAKRSSSEFSGKKTPIIDYAIWPTAGRLIRLPSRMPWLNGAISLTHHSLRHGPGKVGDTGGRVDR